MVSEVSAIDVASTTLRRPGGDGAMARSCTSASSAPNSATTSTDGIVDALAQHRLGAADLAGAGQEHQHRPGSARSARAAASATCRSIGAAHRGRDSASRPGRRGPRFRPPARRRAASPPARRRWSPTSPGACRSSRSPRCTSRASAEPEIGVERALVEFVEQQRRDAVERGIVEHHAREHAFGDDLDRGSCATPSSRSARDSRRSRPPPRRASPPSARRRRAPRAGAAPAR